MPIERSPPVAMAERTTVPGSSSAADGREDSHASVSAVDIARSTASGARIVACRPTCAP